MDIGNIRGIIQTGYQPEAQLEKNMVEQLIRQGCEQVKLPDYDALLHNFHSQVNRFNERKLEEIYEMRHL